MRNFCWGIKVGVWERVGSTTYVWATVSALLCLVCPVLLSYVTVKHVLFLENK